MIGFALFGAGRIGKMHADYIASHPQAKLHYVYDFYQPAATEVADKHGAQAIDSVDQALNDDRVQAVLIATSTDSHVELLIKAAKAGKAILCEKPIDLDSTIVDRCWEEIKDCNVPIQVGFNRRFDPGHLALKSAILAGDIGQLEQLVITSRDSAISPLQYLKSSGGMFRDMVIHDFDIARFILDEELVEIQVYGSALVDPQLSDIGDIDSAMVIMKTASGRLVHINCSRRAAYGYDQRIEVLGSEGMLLSDNPRPHSLLRYSAQHTEAKERLFEFFIDRYHNAFDSQMNAFVNALASGMPVSPNFEDGRRAQRLADAAQLALESGQAVKLNLD